ncbi:MAG: bifunctional aldolase/short-chain dehydrogenase [Deltaproteobacteria bacterium]|nr:bifunctional aldolase/short-chain dehydrogenase [Deltaproteobacteria bacterium]
MESRFGPEELARYRERYSEQGEALADRVYTSRLIGAEPDLVLHGGGNTSVKTSARDLFGRDVRVLHVKGSGSDLARIEPAGLPALLLQPLLELRALGALSDENMVAQQRRALVDPTAPTPSIETLLHAFLPAAFVDHSHADAILALTNQPDGASRVRALFGSRVGWVPWAMPGFALAKSAVEIFEKDPDVVGLVLEKHGLVTFGDDAKTSYERHIELVGRARSFIDGQTEGRRPLDARPVVAMREWKEIASVVRGALAVRTGDLERPFRRFVLEKRSSDEILHFAAAEQGPELAASAPITPDHVIRTKGRYLFIERPPYGNLEALATRLREEIEEYRSSYAKYFDRNVAAKRVERTMLDPTPRVLVLPGIGLVAAGATRRDARIAADIAEHTVRTKIWAASIGRYEGLSEGELFDMEYWSLEQAKLRRDAQAKLEGQVALVTGGAGAIGEGVARELLRAGANVVLVDVDEARLAAATERIGDERCLGVRCDVTDEGDVRDAFLHAAERFGGVDVVVVNAGVARVGALADLALSDFEAAVDVNLKGAFLTLREALFQLRRQATGGNIVLVSTKNVFAPGIEFGAYSASKAGAHQLGRVAALEGAAIGVRVNLVNADAVFGEAENRSGLWQEVGPGRAAARGIAPEELEEFYRNRNLLKARVTAGHVGRAVVFFACQETPTTGAVLPVDGGLPDAFPR